MSFIRWALRYAALLLVTSIPIIAFAGEAPELIQSQVMEVATLQSQNRHREVIDYLEKHVGQAEPTAKQLFDLCLAYSATGRFGKMTKCFDQLQRKSPDGRVLLRVAGGGVADITSTAYQVIMRGYAKIGEYEKAIAAGQRSLDSISTPNTLQRASTLGALGTIHAQQGNLAKAEEIVRRIREIDPSTPGTSKDLEVQQVLSINMALFEVYKASRNYQQALEAFDKTDVPDSPGIVQWYAQQGKSADLKEINEYGKATRSAVRANLMLELGRTAEALPLYNIAFAHPRFSLAAGLYWTTLYNRGRLAEGNGQGEEAIQFYMRAISEVEQQRASISNDAGKIGFVGDKQELYASLIDALVRAKRDGAAFDYAERAKARALVDMLAGRDTQLPADGEVGEVLTKLGQLQDELTAVAAGNGTQARERSIRTRSMLAETTARLQQSAPELASLVSVSSLGEARLRALLQPDETLVEYYGFGDKVYAFVVTLGTVRAVPLDGQGLNEMVRSFRAAVQNPQSRDVAALAGRLHARLIAPLALPARGKLLIVPHGILHYLPFNALAGGKDYLLDRYSIRLLPSASVLSFLNQRKASGSGLLIFGNPDLGNPEYDLPGAQKEAAEIAQLRPGATLLLRADASKAAAIRQGGKFAYLHFASHGKFNAAQPLQSGLYLAGDKASGASGTLTVDDLYSLHLNADLVTLSACETALGHIDNGDDVIGLTRGFFYAGVASVISSLWAVDDTATYEMMTRFYRELSAGSKAEALLKAQRAVKAKYPHPFYWAAFQLAGRR